MKSVMREFVVAAKAGPRLYLAPLIGAFEAVRSEVLKDEAKRGAKKRVKAGAGRGAARTAMKS